MVAAHPDDEILGCGGTLLRHARNGDQIFVCVVTAAHSGTWPEEYIERKVTESKKVDQILGTKKRFFCNFPTVKLNTIPTGEFNSKISKVIDEVNPDIVYTHYENDINKDHQLVYEAVMVGTRPIKRKIKVRCFETLSASEWNNKPFSPNMYIDVGEFIEKKVQLFRIYESEVMDHPHPRSPEGIRILAAKRGMDVCSHYAEAFIVVRDFWE